MIASKNPNSFKQIHFLVISRRALKNYLTLTLKRALKNHLILTLKNRVLLTFLSIRMQAFIKLSNLYRNKLESIWAKREFRKILISQKVK